ncbi:MAG: electron transfer flavoprotein subunit beta/FixA family protein [Firmicutes bacterium]|nr:electron transfer flavoprotein subunit beta/FixA family protein [Bacillota bacterium]
MKIIVCIKQVPDTEAQIKINSDGSGIVAEGIKWVLNPYDEFAVEEAIRVKERLKEGEVTVITLGSQQAKEALRACLAMGADKAVHLADEAFTGADSGATALILSLAIKNMEYDIILCGKQAVDGDMAQVGSSLAEFLDMPFVSNITKLEISADKKSAKVQRETEGASEIIESTLPAVFSAQKGLNEPRYASLMGIMQAKKKEIKEIKAQDLGIEKETVKQMSKMHLLKFSPPTQRPPGRMIQGEPRDTAIELVKLLHEEAKVI